MKARVLFLLLLFVSQTIYADNIKDSTEQEINKTLTTVGILAFLTIKAGAIKVFLLGCSGLVIPIAKIAVAVGIAGYGIKKGWDWYTEREKVWQEVKGLKKDTKELSREVKKVGDGVREGGKKADSMQRKLAKSGKETQERFDTIDENFEGLRAGQTSIKKRFDMLATKLQVNQLSGSQKELLGKLMIIMDRMGVADGAREEILNETHENGKKVESLLESMNFCKDEISELKKMLNLSRRADELSEIRKMVGSSQESNDLLHVKLDLLLGVVYGALPSNDPGREQLKKLTGESHFGLSGKGTFDRNRVAETV